MATTAGLSPQTRGGAMMNRVRSGETAIAVADADTTVESERQAMTDSNDDQTDKDSELTVTPRAAPDEMSVPDQLRDLADHLENDEDAQLIAGVVGIDKSEDGDGLAGYTVHLTAPAFDELSAERTLEVADRYNQAAVANAFEIGLRDATAGADASAGPAQMMGAVPGGGLPAGLEDDLSGMLDALFGGGDGDGDEDDTDPDGGEA